MEGDTHAYIRRQRMKLKKEKNDRSLSASTCFSVHLN